ncbi:MAG: 1-(5-phosphoribosyl)-5-[(5-phosphoribosylamino)methylideneamino] imidazole-4-carboxamide isomerase [Polyangiaceae bacterium]|nr:1-(5-phosphoribosyl)-5-[(5-phosphoribosylamino)methylideneamino] imidazole-4-carboxamide isomerase [Polyangiaceae bacterium]
MDLIPAIDLLHGGAVRLRQGDYAQVTHYPVEPAELAARWRGRVHRLHVVDLEGARQGLPAQRDLVARVARAFGPGVEIGGGVRSMQAIEEYLDLGIDRVVLGTAALLEPELVQRAALAYPDRIIVAVDARDGFVATHGWLQQSRVSAIDTVRHLARLPLGAVLYTDIDRDGTEAGPNVTETVRLAREGGLPVIASGGIGVVAHLERLAEVAPPTLIGVIVGRALHEGRFSLDDALGALARSPAPV